MAYLSILRSNTNQQEMIYVNKWPMSHSKIFFKVGTFKVWENELYHTETQKELLIFMY